MDSEPSSSRRAWHWLLLLTPAVEMLAVCVIVEQTTTGYGGINALLINMFIFALLCLGLGIWWMWRERTVMMRILLGICVGIGICMVNGLIAFAGCSMGIMT